MKETKTIQIEVPADKKAEWQEVGGKTVLVMVDEKDNRPVTERIKTFADACNALGDEHPLVIQYRLTDGAFKGDSMTEDFIAYLKLRIITAALNEGWEPQFTKGERRWYFWYKLISKEQYDKLSAENNSRVVGRSYNSSYAGGGLVYASAHNAFSYSSSYHGSRLAFKSEKLAAYAGRQFAEIYADFCFKPKS